MEASSLHMSVQMVAAGLGVTPVPRLSVEAQITRGTDISLAPPAAPASRETGLERRRASATADEFGLPASILSELAELS